MNFYDLMLAESIGGSGGGGGGSADYGTLVDGSYSGVLDISSATKVKAYGLAYLTNATGLKAPNVTSIGTYAMTGSNAFTVVAFPSVTSVDSNAFRQMNELTTTDFGSTLTGIGNNAWLNSSKFNTLIIRKTTVQSIANTGMFNGTCFASDGTGGTLYVPQALISSYQSATNWSTLLGYANNQIKKIEGTIYETQYADGTLIGS